MVSSNPKLGEYKESVGLCLRLLHSSVIGIRSIVFDPRRMMGSLVDKAGSARQEFVDNETGTLG